MPIVVKRRGRREIRKKQVEIFVHLGMFPLLKREEHRKYFPGLLFTLWLLGLLL
jgi:hypothetical protein